MASTAAVLSTCRRDTVLEKLNLGLTLITDLGFGGQISKLGPQSGKTLSFCPWCRVDVYLLMINRWQRKKAVIFENTKILFQ